MVYRPFLVLLLFCIILPGFSRTGSAQTVMIGDRFEEYVRLMAQDDEGYEYLPSFLLRPVRLQSWKRAGFDRLNHPWEAHPFFAMKDSDRRIALYVHEPEWFSSFNSRLPAGENDGALWQGRGYNTRFTAGVELEGPFFSATIRPELLYSANRSFPLSPLPTRYGPFATPQSFLQDIDLPQRFGEDPITTLHPGQSRLELFYKSAAIGFSSANLWTGPAVETPMIFSNHAPGFYHAYLRSREPLKTAIGRFEWYYLAGKLHESDFFEEADREPERLITSLMVGYSPPFAPNLQIGAVRMFQQYYPAGGPGLSDLGMVFQHILKQRFATEENPTGEDDVHQLLSLLGRLHFPEAGIELYAEWGRNDHSKDSRDLVRHFEHARFYLLGFVKRFQMEGNRWLAVRGEMAQIEVPRLHQFRATGSVYQNNDARQGFTNRGQMIGAFIGPGSNRQSLSATLFKPSGLMAFRLARTVHHNDRMYQFFQRGRLDSPFAENHPMVELSAGLEWLRFMANSRLELEAGFELFYILNDSHQYKSDLLNARTTLRLRYRLLH